MLNIVHTKSMVGSAVTLPSTKKAPVSSSAEPRVPSSIGSDRHRHSGQPLDPGRSDRLLRFARLFRLAVELHDGDEEAARDWLRKPARALDGETPLDRADTEAGAREVENLIGRLEHGVYT